MNRLKLNRTFDDLESKEGYLRRRMELTPFKEIPTHLLDPWRHGNQIILTITSDYISILCEAVNVEAARLAWLFVYAYLAAPYLLLACFCNHFLLHS